MSYTAIEKRLQSLENHFGPKKLAWLEPGEEPKSDDKNTIYLKWLE